MGLKGLLGLGEIALEIPGHEHALDVDGDEVAVVLGQREADDLAGVPEQRGRGPAGLGVPHADRLVRRAREQLRAVLVEHEVHDVALVAVEALDALVGVGFDEVPDHHALIRARGRGETPSGRERGGVDRFLMAREDQAGEGAPARLELPHDGLGVLARRQEALAVGADVDGVDRADMGARWEVVGVGLVGVAAVVPHEGVAVDRARDQPAPVGGQGEGRGVARVARELDALDHQVALGEVPGDDLGVLPRGHGPAVARVDAQVVDRPAVRSAEGHARGRGVLGVELPDPQGVVARGGHGQHGVRADHDLADRARVAREHEGVAPRGLGLEIPHAGALVLTRADQPVAVVAHVEGEHRHLVAGQGGALAGLAVVQRPDDHAAVVAARVGRAAVACDGDVGDRRAVAVEDAHTRGGVGRV